MPPPGIALSDDQQRRAGARGAQQTANLQADVSIDAVGEMVLKAVRESALYIHTDRVMQTLVAQRAKAILDAMPA